MIGVSLLGATGSIGASTLAVLRQHRDTFRLVAVASRTDWQGLLPIIAEFEPEVCALEDAAAATALREALSRHHAHVRIEVGADAVTAAASMSSTQIVVAGISGFAGLPSTWAAVAAGKQVLLANKEALVASGTLLLAQAKNAQEIASIGNQTGGRVFLLEFRGEDPRVPIKPLHKMTEAQARLELEAAGFRFVSNLRPLPWQHFLVFTRP